MGHLKVILSDAGGLARVCGPVVAFRWLLAIVLTFPQIKRTGNLQPADQALGEGPFRCRFGNAQAVLSKPRIISGIREIWVRDVYLQHGFLTINDGDTVVDLGCNNGNFTLLALAHGPKIRTISVEVKASEIECVKEQLASNNWQQRATIVNAFIGRDREQSERLRAAVGGDAHLAGIITEDELIERHSIQRIDMLKCDIEGSEFDLLTRDSKILAMTRQIAIELHKDIGDADAFIAMLHDMGFETKRAQVENSEAMVVSGRRSMPN